MAVGSEHAPDAGQGLAEAAHLGAAVLAAHCALSPPVYLSANGVVACLLGGEDAQNLLVRCRCAACAAAPPLVFPTPRPPGAPPGGTCILDLRSWAAHARLVPPDGANGCSHHSGGGNIGGAWADTQRLLASVAAGYTEDPSGHDTLWQELRMRAAALGGGPGLAGRSCWVLDAAEAAHLAAAAAAEASRGAAGDAAAAAAAASGMRLPARAWVEARVEAWDREHRLLVLSAEGQVFPALLGACWLHWGAAPPAPGEPPMPAPAPPLVPPPPAAAGLSDAPAGRKASKKRRRAADDDSSDDDWLPDPEDLAPQIQIGPHIAGQIGAQIAGQPPLLTPEQVAALLAGRPPAARGGGGGAAAAGDATGGAGGAAGEGADAGQLEVLFTHMLKDPRPIKPCHTVAIRLPREAFVDRAYGGAPPAGRVPVWLRLDGALRGLGFSAAAGANPRSGGANAHSKSGGGKDGGCYVEVRNVLDPRTGKGCGEAHGKMRRLLGDLAWAGVILGFSRARRAADGQEGLLLIAERRDGLEALAAAEAARRAAKAAAGGGGGGAPGGGGGGGGGGGAAAGVAAGPAGGTPAGTPNKGLKRRLSGISEGGSPGKAPRRAERIPVTVEGASFWYSEAKLITEAVVQSGWHLPRKWVHAAGAAPGGGGGANRDMAVTLLERDGGGGSGGGEGAGGGGEGAGGGAGSGGRGGGGEPGGAAPAPLPAPHPCGEEGAGGGPGSAGAAAPMETGEAAADGSAGGAAAEPATAGGRGGGADSSGGGGDVPMGDADAPAPPGEAPAAAATAAPASEPGASPLSGAWREVASGVAKLTQCVHSKHSAKMQYKLQHRGFQDLVGPLVGWYIIGASVVMEDDATAAATAGDAAAAGGGAAAAAAGGGALRVFVRRATGEEALQQAAAAAAAVAAAEAAAAEAAAAAAVAAEAGAGAAEAGAALLGAAAAEATAGAAEAPPPGAVPAADGTAAGTVDASEPLSNVTPGAGGAEGAPAPAVVPGAPPAAPTTAPPAPQPAAGASGAAAQAVAATPAGAGAASLPPAAAFAPAGPAAAAAAAAAAPAAPSAADAQADEAALGAALRALALPELAVSPTDADGLRSAVVEADRGIGLAAAALGLDRRARRGVLNAFALAARDPDRRWTLVSLDYRHLREACAEGDAEWAREVLADLAAAGPPKP